ncbi:MAG: hypothetical protein ABJF10_15125 [Chthoniobacter sp.]|uniref:hypothetical protein n=1 Tax=Chthoniobacter sp. TaxID=2510640 RepID=UPI0032A7EA6F
MNSILVPENQNPPAHGAARFVPFLVILVAAIAYYASYWHFWFNPHDEGGTACLVAQRLMQGERPWVDVEPGYNIGWFYPIVGLFHFTGVNYLAVRAWFFALSTVTALLGCGIVTRVTGSRWAGLATGLLLVVFPGSQFKNYIPLAEAANLACIIHLLYIDPVVRRKWLAAAALGGVVLGLTFLVRVELGFFFTAIWLLLLIVGLLDHRLPFGRRFAGAIFGVVALVLGVVVAQAPAYTYLSGRGLRANYWAEYTEWFEFLRASANQKIAHEKTVPPAVAGAAQPPADATGDGATAQTAPAIHNAENGDRTALPRRPLSAMIGKGWRERILTFLTYAPLVGFAVFFIAGVLGFVVTVLRREFTLSAVPLLWLLLIGGSLTTFPQFFFFRPDRPHLSEFMPGYIIAMAASLWLLWPHGPVRPMMQRAFAGLVALFLGGQLLAFALFALQHPSAGTIVARAGRKARFQGENGVRVHTSKKEAATLQGVYDAVMKSSGPKDYVICFPYMPGYNIMTNRPTYLRNVYVDNATRGEHWAENTIRDFEEKRPAVVIIDDREINGTAASKFSRWGAPVYAYLKKNYAAAGKFETVEVFVPKPPVPVDPAPAAGPAPSPVPAAEPAPTPVPAAPAPATPAPAEPAR